MFKGEVLKSNQLLFKKWKKSFNNDLVRILLVMAYIILFLNKDFYLISLGMLLAILLFTFVFAKSELEFELNQKK